MATERRYLKGDVVEVVEFPGDALLGRELRIVDQQLHSGIVVARFMDFGGQTVSKFYAHQVKLLKRPWWNWLRLPFVKKVVMYQRSTVK